MAFENHPASFDIVSRDASGGGDDAPAPVWTHDGVPYELVDDAQGWVVLVDGRPLGRLEVDREGDESTPGTWRVRDPEHEALGVGASWADWRDALLALIDYRERRES